MSNTFSEWEAPASGRISFKLCLGQNVLEVGFDGRVLAAAKQDRVGRESLGVLYYQVTE